jgi:RNA polymerase sigma factor (sigma-70 family)
MDYKEVEECVIRAKEGSKEDVLKLINHYKGFIHKTATEFYVKNYEIDDLMQVGYIAVLKAISRYKPGSNTFCSYVMSTIRNAVIYIVREISKGGFELSLNTPLKAEEKGIEFIDIVAAETTLEEGVVAAETSQELKAAIEGLSEEEKNFVYKVYYEKMLLACYAREIGISYKAARKMRERVLEKLRHEIVRAM